MLTSISVQGFKSLQDVRDLELGQVNVFVGANGSGKSNLLEAVGLLDELIVGDIIDNQTFLRRGMRQVTAWSLLSSFKDLEAGKKTIVRGVWSDAQDTAGLEIEIDSNADALHQLVLSKLRYELNDQNATIEWQKSESLSEIIIKPKFVLQPPLKDFLSVLSEYAIFSPHTPSLRGLEPDPTQRSPLGLRGGGLAKAVSYLLDVERSTFGTLDLDDLLQLLDWVDEIAIGGPSHESVPPFVPMTRDIIVFTDRRMKEGRNQLSAYDASEGALYVLFALVLALHPHAPRLLAIENMDQAMHPRLARATIRLFCQQVLQSSPQRQVLLTTHNPLVLDGLNLRDDRIRLFTVERNKYGATRVDRVQVSDEIIQAVEGGLTLSRLWVMGRLGGVPDIF